MFNLAVVTMEIFFATKTYNKRQKNLLSYPKHKPSAFESNPPYMSLKLYNDLPSPMVGNSFKLKLNTLLYSQKFLFELNNVVIDTFMVNGLGL